MDSGNTDYEDGTLISSQDLSRNPRHRVKNKDRGLNRSVEKRAKRAFPS